MTSVYLAKIKKLSKISVSKACNTLKINRANLLNGRSKQENEKKVYDYIVEEYKNVIENKNNQ